MKKYLIFDFDGTIADTFHIVKEIGEEYAKKYSIKIDHKKAKGLGLRKFIMESKFPMWKIYKILPEAKKRITSRLKGDVKPFPGMKIVLKRLSENYNLGIVSTNSNANILSFLKKQGISGLFKFVHSDSSIFGKHFVLKRLCKKHNIPYDAVVYVGDEDRDIISAKRIGIKTIAVTWGYNSKKLLSKHKPDYLVSSPRQILRVLNIGIPPYP